MFVANNRLQISKGYFSFRSFYKAYRNAERNYPNSHFVVHFRFATSGKRDAGTCHPFAIDKTIAFVHNGIFNKLGNDKISDTTEFKDSYLKMMPRNFMYNAKSVRFLKRFCGWFNKLVFLNNKNDYLIINETAGQWLDGCWFSNVVEYSKLSDDYDDDDEMAIWESCSACFGYYPVKEMQTIENGELICNDCFAAACNEDYTLEKICHNCGRVIDYYENDVCSCCGVFA